LPLDSDALKVEVGMPRQDRKELAT
jgi:hypothetical protein